MNRSAISVLVILAMALLQIAPTTPSAFTALSAMHPPFARADEQIKPPATSVSSRSADLLAAPTSTPALAASLSAFACSSVTGMPVAECEALVALYNSTNGGAWTNRTGWLVATTACTWYGVTCSAGHVSRILLPGNHLCRQHPSGISQPCEPAGPRPLRQPAHGRHSFRMGGMASVRTFNLSGNQLSGLIPIELANLTDVRTYSTCPTTSSPAIS